LHGRILDNAIGAYRYQKWGTNLDVTVYLMEVAQVDANWQEGDLRDRVWLTGNEVRKRLDRDDVAAIFEAALNRI